MDSRTEPQGLGSATVPVAAERVSRSASRLIAIHRFLNGNRFGAAGVWAAVGFGGSYWSRCVAAPGLITAGSSGGKQSKRGPNTCWRTNSSGGGGPQRTWRNAAKAMGRKARWPDGFARKRQRPCPGLPNASTWPWRVPWRTCRVLREENDNMRLLGNDPFMVGKFYAQWPSGGKGAFLASRREEACQRSMVQPPTRASSIGQNYDLAPFTRFL